MNLCDLCVASVASPPGRAALARGCSVAFQIACITGFWPGPSDVWLLSGSLRVRYDIHGINIIGEYLWYNYKSYLIYGFNWLPIY